MEIGALYSITIIAALRIYWFDLDISTSLVNFLAVSALFSGVFGQILMFELYLDSIRPISVTFLAFLVIKYYIL